MKEKLISSLIGLLVTALGFGIFIFIVWHGDMSSRLLRNAAFTCIAVGVAGLVGIFIPWNTRKSSTAIIRQVMLVKLDERAGVLSEIAELNSQDISKIKSLIRKEEDYSVSLLANEFEYADFALQIVTDEGDMYIYPGKDRADIVMCEKVIGYGKEMTEDEAANLKEIVNKYYAW